MNYCGIDLASRESAVVILDSSALALRRVTVETDLVGFRRAFEGVGPLRVIIEASPLAEMVANYVETLGHEPVIIDARAAKNLMNAKKKTDPRDAHTLAEIGRCGWYIEVHRKSPEARELRSLLKARQALQKTSKAQLNSIRGLLRAQGLRLGKVSNGQFEDTVMTLVNREIPGLSDAFAGMLQVWALARVEAARLEKHIRQRSRTDQVTRRFEQVYGVGPLTSVLYRATLDDPHRFRHAEEVADYLGLAPRVSQSGDTAYRGRITREGDHLLRWHLVECAHVLLTKGRDCALKQWGLQLQRRKGSAKAKVAVARKLAVLLWRLWKEEKDFEAFPQAA
ncbi:IS110 family transposase [Marinobacterium aestuarii]|uniref:IS110 family transposase n=1 Tax=Marinobacterium aestuarii TaxID=1821621 RepID=UPI000A01C66C|nr:IS110 family transposase [Marinobacterium aestuarii]